MNHQKGRSLNIKSNICGGLELDVNHTPNSLGDRTINVLATKAGAQMVKYHGDTSMVNDAAMLKVGLYILYKTIVSNSWREGLCTGATGNYYLDRSSIGPCGHFYNSSNDPCPEERININNININNMTTLYKTIVSKYRILAPSPRGAA